MKKLFTMNNVLLVVVAVVVYNMFMKPKPKTNGKEKDRKTRKC